MSQEPIKNKDSKTESPLEPENNQAFASYKDRYFTQIDDPGQPQESCLEALISLRLEFKEEITQLIANKNGLRYKLRLSDIDPCSDPDVIKVIHQSLLECDQQLSSLGKAVSCLDDILSESTKNRNILAVGIKKLTKHLNGLNKVEKDQIETILLSQSLQDFTLQNK